MILRTSRFDELARITPNVASAEYVVGERRVVDVPGDHLTMLSEPHVAAVAAAIEDALAFADQPDHTRHDTAAAHDP